jgi:hypothetical protein
VLGVVQRGARKPLGTRHLGAAENGTRLLVEADAEELGHRRPESRLVVHRPGVQRRIVLRVDAAVLAHPVGELREGTPVLRVGGPQDVGGFGVAHAVSMQSRQRAAPGLTVAQTHGSL